MCLVRMERGRGRQQRLPMNDFIRTGTSWRPTPGTPDVSALVLRETIDRPPYGIVPGRCLDKITFFIPSEDEPWETLHSIPLGSNLGKTASMLFLRESDASLDTNHPGFERTKIDPFLTSFPSVPWHSPAGFPCDSFPSTSNRCPFLASAAFAKAARNSRAASFRKAPIDSCCPVRPSHPLAFRIRRTRNLCAFPFRNPEAWKRP